jgi:hypothetical protein
MSNFSVGRGLSLHPSSIPTIFQRRNIIILRTQFEKQFEKQNEKMDLSKRMEVCVETLRLIVYFANGEGIIGISLD